jgi:penicillin-binding protein 1C
LREIEVCADSGWAAGADCARTETVLVPAFVKSLPLCPYCASVALSADGRYRVRAEEEAPGSVRVEKRFVLPPSMERFYARSLDYKSLPPWKPGSVQSSNQDLAVVAPEEGASIFVPIEITGRPGATVFSVAHRDPAAVVFWHLDGVYLGSTRKVHAIEARPEPGEHVLTVVDGSGRSVSRHFTVLSKN